MPRQLANIPDSVSVDSLVSHRTELASMSAIEGGDSIVLDMTKFSDAGGLFSPRSRLWHAIAHQHLNGTLDVTSTTPSVTISAGTDGEGYGEIAADGLALREGLPAWRPDMTGPVLDSLALEASNVYVDVTMSEGVYTNGGPLQAAAVDLAFAANGGTATDCVVSSIKKNDNAVEGSASALTGGETVIRVFLTVSGTPDGNETITIGLLPASAEDNANNPVTGNTEAVALNS